MTRSSDDENDEKRHRREKRQRKAAERARRERAHARTVNQFPEPWPQWTYLMVSGHLANRVVECSCSSRAIFVVLPGDEHGKPYHEDGSDSRYCWRGMRTVPGVPGVRRPTHRVRGAR
jgi:hypothetical protein